MHKKVKCSLVCGVGEKTCLALLHPDVPVSVDLLPSEPALPVHAGAGDHQQGEAALLV